jgi:hypothetical protein
MDRQLVSEQIDALRLEAVEARRLAETLGDAQSILDLENYAAHLEAEAMRLASRTNRTTDAPKRRAVEDLASAGHTSR